MFFSHPCYFNTFILFYFSLMKIGLLLDQRMGWSSEFLAVWDFESIVPLVRIIYQSFISSVLSFIYIYDFFLFSLVGILPNRIIQPIAEHSEYPVERLGNILSLFSHHLMWNCSFFLVNMWNCSKHQILCC